MANGTSAELVQVCWDGDLQTVCDIIDAGALVNGTGQITWTGYYGHEDVSEYWGLLRQQYTTNAVVTPLAAAAHKGHFEIARVLIQAGANPNVPCDGGDAVFHAAVGGASYPNDPTYYRRRGMARFLAARKYTPKVLQAQEDFYTYYHQYPWRWPINQQVIDQWNRSIELAMQPEEQAFSALKQIVNALASPMLTKKARKNMKKELYKKREELYRLTHGKRNAPDFLHYYDFFTINYSEGQDKYDFNSEYMKSLRDR